MPSSNEPRPRNRFVLSALFAAAAVLVVVVFLFLTRNNEPKGVTAPAASRLAVGPAERASATNIRIENIALSRAENFLHQEVAALSGEAINAGGRSLATLELSVEFFDYTNQIALRETHSVSEVAAPLAPGEHRAFEVSFEHIPSSWNMRQPTVRVTRLQLLPN